MKKYKYYDTFKKEFFTRRTVCGNVRVSEFCASCQISSLKNAQKAQNSKRKEERNENFENLAKNVHIRKDYFLRKFLSFRA